MTITVEESSTRLLKSAAKLSRIPDEEIDWSAPVEEDLYGLSPEHSTLFGTPLWLEMSEAQRKKLTRLEMASIMQTGIWFEMILQEMLLREFYRGQYHSSEFQWAIKEIEEECRHTLMFAKASEKLAGTTFHPPRHVMELGRILKNVAWGEVSYAGILVAEEILDILQRSSRKDERVCMITRQTSDIHVVEEARHMKFAREEIKDHMKDASQFKKITSSALVSAAGYHIVRSLVSHDVYEMVGLKKNQAVAAVAANTHYHDFMRSSASELMSFLESVGLVSGKSSVIYKKAYLL